MSKHRGKAKKKAIPKVGFVLCVRVEGHAPELLAWGAVQVPCSKCGHACWQAPATRRLPFPILCKLCAQPYINHPDSVPVLTREIVAEVMDWVRQQENARNN